MDRAAKDPFALMEELEQVLGIRSCPINWPIGTDGDFQGVYHRDTKMVELYTGGDHGKSMVQKTDIAIDDPALEHVLAKHYRERWRRKSTCWTKRATLSTSTRCAAVS